MNYEEARAFIEERSRYGGELGLDAIRKLLDEVGHPEKNCYLYILLERTARDRFLPISPQSWRWTDTGWADIYLRLFTATRSGYR